MTDEDIYSKYLNASHYQNLTPEVAENMRKLGLDPKDVRSVKNISGLSHSPKGPLDSASTKFLVLEGDSGMLKKLLLKSYPESMINEGVKNHPSQQYLHMIKGNSILLPFPIGIAYERSIRGDQVEGKKNPSTSLIHNLLSEYLEGPSHAEYAIYLSSKLKNYEESPLAKSIDKEKLDEDIKKIEKSKKFLIEDGLRTINELATYGSYHLDMNDFKTLSLRKTISSQIGKAQDFTRDYILYKKFTKGLITLDKIHQNDIPKDIESEISNAKNTLEEIIPVLIAPTLDGTKWVYGQRDMVPHHLKFNFYTDLRNGERKFKTYVFDFCKAGWGNIAKDKTKLLLSHLLELKYEQFKDFIQFSLDDEKRLRGEFIEKLKQEEELTGRLMDLEKIRMQRPLNLEEELKTADLLAFYENIKNMGRPAKNIVEKDLLKRYNEFISIQLGSLENKYINIPGLEIPKSDLIPEPIISNKPYSAEESIPKSERSFKERSDIVLSEKTLYKLDEKQIKAVNDLSKIYKDYI